MPLLHGATAGGGMSSMTALAAPGGVSARCAAAGQVVSEPTGTSDHASTNCEEAPGGSRNGDGPGNPLSIPPPGMLIVGIGALGSPVAFYLAALAGYMLRKARAKVTLLAVPYVLCLLSWATVVAFFRFLAGRQQATWVSGATYSAIAPSRRDRMRSLKTA